MSRAMSRSPVRSGRYLLHDWRPAAADRSSGSRAGQGARDRRQDPPRATRAGRRSLASPCPSMSPATVARWTAASRAGTGNCRSPPRAPLPNRYSGCRNRPERRSPPWSETCLCGHAGIFAAAATASECADKKSASQMPIHQRTKLPAVKLPGASVEAVSIIALRTSRGADTGPGSGRLRTVSKGCAGVDDAARAGASVALSGSRLTSMVKVACVD